MLMAIETRVNKEILNNLVHVDDWFYYHSNIHQVPVILHPLFPVILFAS